jgi:cell division protein FtsQ
VRTVDVQGAVYTDPERLSEIVDGLQGDAILLVDTRQIERQLESIAWVESARVSTQFPHRVFIDIRERKPIATFAGSDGKFRVIDRDGRVLDVVDGTPIDYMLVTGANPDVERGQFAGRPFASAAQLAIALPSEIRALTRSIGVDATAGDLELELGDDVEVLLGPATDMSSKLVRLLSEVRGGLEGICRLDVSTSEISRTAC